MKKIFCLICIPLFCVTPSEKKYLSSWEHSKLIESLTCKIDTPLDERKIKTKAISYGKSQKGKNLVAYIVQSEKGAEPVQNVYLIAAQHGDERNSKVVLDYFLREVRLLSRDFQNNHRILVIPLYNPDGYSRRNRLALNKTDLNRDFPTDDAGAENPKALETEAFLSLMRKYPPKVIFNLHQPFRVVLPNKGSDSYGKEFATLSDYPLGHGVGYPTPGSLGTWAAENEIQIVTVEMSRSMRKAMAPFIYEEVRLALFNAAFGCIPRPAHRSRLEKYLDERE